MDQHLRRHAKDVTFNTLGLYAGESELERL